MAAILYRSDGIGDFLRCRFFYAGAGLFLQIGISVLFVMIFFVFNAHFCKWITEIMDLSNFLYLWLSLFCILFERVFTTIDSL